MAVLAADVSAHLFVVLPAFPNHSDAVCCHAVMPVHLAKAVVRSLLDFCVQGIIGVTRSVLSGLTNEAATHIAESDRHNNVS